MSFQMMHQNVCILLYLKCIVLDLVSRKCHKNSSKSNVYLSMSVVNPYYLKHGFVDFRQWNKTVNSLIIRHDYQKFVLLKCKKSKYHENDILFINHEICLDL